MNVPERPKIFHIVHVDKLPSIIADGHLWSDKIVIENAVPGTTIGMSRIKQRRLEELNLSSHSTLRVGECVPFYFCPRSIMLYLIHMRNAELTYSGGQGHIVHLQADLYQTVEWAEKEGRRWAFTLSNGGSYYFEDSCDLARLGDLDWAAIKTNNWASCKEGKQAEFLCEDSFSWSLVEGIGVPNRICYQSAMDALGLAGHTLPVEIKTGWYY